MTDHDFQKIGPMEGAYAVSKCSVCGLEVAVHVELKVVHIGYDHLVRENPDCETFIARQVMTP